MNNFIISKEDFINIMQKMLAVVGHRGPNTPNNVEGMAAYYGFLCNVEYDILNKAIDQIIIKEDLKFIPSISTILKYVDIVKNNGLDTDTVNELKKVNDYRNKLRREGILTCGQSKQLLK